jgi:hypothetical protein
MAPEWLGQYEVDGRELVRESLLLSAQVAADVDACGQKIWHQHHASGPLRDAAAGTVLDVRRSHLQESSLHDRKNAAPAELNHCVV